MNTKNIAIDYLRKSKARFQALHTLLEQNSYDDVIREAQEILELITKGALRWIGVDPPKTHDVSLTLKKHHRQFPAFWQQEMDWICKISNNLYQERGHAFYGDEGEDISPANLFEVGEAQEAVQWIQKLIALYENLIEAKNQAPSSKTSIST